MADHSGLPEQFESTRTNLHRIAAHVLARRRYEVTGRFGLRASPGGFATPAFGENAEVLRVDRGFLLIDSTAGTAYAPITGSSLTQLAQFAGCNLATDFSAGEEMPSVGDPDEPIKLGLESSSVIAAWYHVGWQMIDATVTGRPPQSQPATLQLWPEHFDAGTHVGLSNGQRVNLGVSPGDSYSNEPYLYVGPFNDDRPGDPSFWNASFGAALGRTELLAGPDPIARGIEFLRTGLALLDG